MSHFPASHHRDSRRCITIYILHIPSIQVPADSPARNKQTMDIGQRLAHATRHARYTSDSQRLASSERDTISIKHQPAVGLVGFLARGTYLASGWPGAVQVSSITQELVVQEDRDIAAGNLFGVGYTTRQDGRHFDRAGERQQHEATSDGKREDGG